MVAALPRSHSRASCRYTAFLTRELDGAQLAAVLPPFEELVSTYGMPAPVVFRAAHSAMAVAEAGSPWHPKSQSLADATRSALKPSPDWNSISPRLYLLFWSLSLYDIYVPESQYSSQAKLLKHQRDMVSSEDLTVRGQPGARALPAG